MSQWVNLEMTYTNYSMLCDAVMEAATHAEGFYEMQERVHLLDFLESEYLRDCKKQELDRETWDVHEKLLRNQEMYHPIEFQRVKSVLDDYEDKKLFEWNISEQDKFHLICALIDVFKKDDSNKNKDVKE